MKKIRILVVDDESVVREGVVAILRLQKDLDVVGEANMEQSLSSWQRKQNQMWFFWIWSCLYRMGWQLFPS